MKLAPGVSEKDFKNAIAQFEKAIGKQWVFTSKEDVNLYRDAYSPFKGTDDELVASAAVAPGTTEEVQAIVRIANQLKIPIYPISTGKNLGYGGSAPAMSGCVVLDLKRMNRIIEVNEKNAYALVEPGVSYFDLYHHLRDNGCKLWVDTPDPGWGSLIGNAMDRGGGWTAAKYRDHFGAHCGMEVVLPNGELMRTGMGAMPNSKTWQQYKTGFGPWVDGIFSQSNLGVVTKMGFWLMPQPEASLMGHVSVFKYEDLIPLIDTINYLENAEIFTGLPILFGPLTNNKYIMGHEEVKKPTPPELYQVLAKYEDAPYPELEKFCRANNMGLWGVRLQFYGPAEVIRAQWDYCKKRFSAIDGVKFEDEGIITMPMTEEQVKKSHKVTYGIANLDAFVNGARSAEMPEPSHGHLVFSPVIPRNGEDILKAHRIFTQASKELGIGIPGRPPAVVMTNIERSFIYAFTFPVSLDAETNRKNRETFSKIIKIAADNGWGEYRTCPAFYDEIMDTYSFNNHILRRFHETLKDAIDPNGIISPGRYGIWPKHLRESK